MRNFVIDDNNKIDTHVPIREKAEDISILNKYKDPELSTFTPIKNKALNSSRVINTSANMNINIINTYNTLFYRENKISNNSKFVLVSIFNGINNIRKYN